MQLGTDYLATLREPALHENLQRNSRYFKLLKLHGN